MYIGTVLFADMCRYQLERTTNLIQTLCITLSVSGRRIYNISLYRKHICENVPTLVQEKRPVLQNSGSRVAGLSYYAWQGSCCNEYRLSQLSG